MCESGSLKVTSLSCRINQQKLEVKQLDIETELRTLMGKAGEYPIHSLLGFIAVVLPVGKNFHCFFPTFSNIFCNTAKVSENLAVNKEGKREIQVPSQF